MSNQYKKQNFFDLQNATAKYELNGSVNLNSIIYDNWFNEQGFKTFKTKSSYWHEAVPYVFQSFPYYLTISPNREELNEIFFKYNIIAIRFSSPVDYHHGIESYHVCTNRKYFYSKKFSKGTISNLKKAKKENFIFKKVSFHNMAKEGWKLRMDSLIRQHRVGTENQKWWRTMCQAASKIHSIESWGLFKNDIMTASIIYFICDNCCICLYQQSRTKYLKYRVNNYLTFLFTEEVLNRSSQPWIFYGLHPLDAPETVDEYKFRLNYFAKPVKQCVIINPKIGKLINNNTFKIIKILAKKANYRHIFSRIEGLLQAYIYDRYSANSD